jgi:hypothetical protein
MEYKIADHIKTRASLAVLIIDDYTNKVISDGSVQVLVEGAKKPIRKAEGYYIFLNLEQKQAELTVKSDRYVTEKRSINLEDLSPKEPILKLRVKPGKNYSLPKGTTIICGTAEPGSEIRVICDNIQKFYRLLYDYDREENQEQIHIYNPENTDMDGKMLCAKSESSCETFAIFLTADRENNGYRLEKPLENSYKKAGTKIYPVFVTKADDTGEYFLPIWSIGDEAGSCLCEMNGSKKESRTINLEAGKMNHLSFF